MRSNSRLVANLLKYGIAVVVGLMLAYTYVSFRVEELRDLAALPAVDRYLILCDAFTIPGVTIFLSGVLMSISNAGGLDGVSYVVGNAVKMLIPGKAAHMEKYKDYLERKRAKRVKGYGFLYVVGIFFLVLAGISMALFYSLYLK